MNIEITNFYLEFLKFIFLMVYFLFFIQSLHIFSGIERKSLYSTINKI